MLLHGQFTQPDWKVPILILTFLYTFKSWNVFTRFIYSFLQFVHTLWFFIYNYSAVNFHELNVKPTQNGVSLQMGHLLRVQSYCDGMKQNTSASDAAEVSN